MNNLYKKIQNALMNFYEDPEKKVNDNFVKNMKKYDIEIQYNVYSNSYDNSESYILRLISKSSLESMLNNYGIVFYINSKRLLEKLLEDSKFSKLILDEKISVDLIRDKDNNSALAKVYIHYSTYSPAEFRKYLGKYTKLYKLPEEESHIGYNIKGIEVNNLQIADGVSIRPAAYYYLNNPVVLNPNLVYKHHVHNFKDDKNIFAYIEDTLKNNSRIDNRYRNNFYYIRVFAISKDTLCDISENSFYVLERGLEFGHYLLMVSYKIEINGHVIYTPAFILAAYKKSRRVTEFLIPIEPYIKYGGLKNVSNNYLAFIERKPKKSK
ncbi:hypothetical protein YN1_5290 [Nanoarchaeota archaeon]